MSGSAQDNDIRSALVRLFLSKHPFYFSTFAIVKEVTQDPDGEKPGLLTAIVQGQDVEKVRWHWPLKPAKNSACIIHYCENQPSQKFATGFDLIEQIKTKIGNDIEFDLKEGKITASCKELDLTINNASIKSDGSKVTINDNAEFGI
jgi:hypothetical protein